jgi:hypothetical protein
MAFDAGRDLTHFVSAQFAHAKGHRGKDQSCHHRQRDHQDQTHPRPVQKPLT